MSKRTPKMTARLIVAKNIRKIRESKGLSQEKLGELCDLHRTYVSSVERGKRNITVDSMEKFAKALEIKIQVLFDNE